MKNILLLIINIQGPDQEARRIRELVSYWKEFYKITIITKDHFDGKIFDHPNIEVIKLPYSFIGKFFITNPKSQIAQVNNSDVQSSKAKFKKFLVRLWRKSKFQRLLFPDKYVFEMPLFRKEAAKQLKSRKYQTVILKSSPFSFMKLSKFIKKTDSSIKIIYDTGDPFYKNCVKGLIEPLQTHGTKMYEKKYLKYIDTLIIPSKAVKRHYHENFPKSVINTSIEVIDQGITLSESVVAKKAPATDTLNMIYAGGIYKRIREPFELYKAIEQINDFKLHLRIFGDIYIDYLPDLKNKKFFFGGKLPNKEIIEELNKTDVIVFIDNAFGVQIPGKILEVIASKKPILFIYENEDSPSFEYINSYKGYVKCLNENAEILKAIQYIKTNYSNFTYDFDLSRYYWDNLAEKYMNLLN